MTDLHYRFDLCWNSYHSERPAKHFCQLQESLYPDWMSRTSTPTHSQWGRGHPKSQHNKLSYSWSLWEVGDILAWSTWSFSRVLSISSFSLHGGCGMSTASVLPTSSNTTQATKNKTTHLSRDSRNCKTSSRSAATASFIQWDDMQNARYSRTAMSWAITSRLAWESSSGWKHRPCLCFGKITPRKVKV